MKKNKIISLGVGCFLILCLGAPAQAQWAKSIKGNGNVETESRDLEDYDQVAVSAGITIHFEQSSQYSVKVEADENLLEYIITEVKGDKLIVRRKKNTNIKRSKAMDVYVTAPNLSYVRASSGSSFKAAKEINGDDLDINVSSGANVNLILDYRNVECSTSSGSNVKLAGNALATKLSSSSGSHLNAKMFHVKKCTASASSSSGIKIWVSENLNASASSGGDVTYYGSPEVNKSETSGGDVHSATR